ncbi:hypothetical protein HX127_13080 [Acinetobacter sp. 256-1]|uniref:hypothetical protein n=1 Tax=Acinetobacter sp. 256-1 TaxID=2746721 RepID=UPI00257656BB|nr:hypothetical protein [Acinetobacter sp. 256-1]MDM1758479.1 hypothetical protein [Acinetobacter sp. 256-1]
MSELFKVPTVSIGEVLTFKGKHYDFFRKIFDRVCTLSTRQAKDGETTRHVFEKILKLECVPHADSYIKDFINNAKYWSLENQSADFLVHFYALNTLDAAYKYCCQEDAAKGNNSLHRLVFGQDNHNYLVDVIDYLADLEKISATHLTNKIVEHFIDKAVEKAKKEAAMEATQGQSKGGQARAKKYEEQKNIIFEEWEKGSFHSYAACARHFANQLGLSTKTIENWLSENYSQTKKKI